MKTRELAVTPEVANESTKSNKIIFKDFEVDSSKCVSKLGAWLAEHVLTTRRDDDASLVSIVLPVTNAGALITNLGKAISKESYSGGGRNYPSFPGYLLTDKSDLERAIKNIRAELDFIEQQSRLFENAEFTVKTSFYQWPVFGSAAAGWSEGVNTPEKFFDYCAKDMFASGYVVRWAGLLRNVLPDSISSKMFKGRGTELLALTTKSTR